MGTRDSARQRGSAASSSPANVNPDSAASASASASAGSGVRTGTNVSTKRLIGAITSDDDGVSVYERFTNFEAYEIAADNEQGGVDADAQDESATGSDRPSRRPSTRSTDTAAVNIEVGRIYNPIAKVNDDPVFKIDPLNKKLIEAGSILDALNQQSDCARRHARGQSAYKVNMNQQRSRTLDKFAVAMRLNTINTNKLQAAIKKKLMGGSDGDDGGGDGGNRMQVDDMSDVDQGASHAASSAAAPSSTANMDSIIAVIRNASDTQAAYREYINGDAAYFVLSDTRMKCAVDCMNRIGRGQIQDTSTAHMTQSKLNEVISEFVVASIEEKCAATKQSILNTKRDIGELPRISRAPVKTSAQSVPKKQRLNEPTITEISANTARELEAGLQSELVNLTVSLPIYEAALKMAKTTCDESVAILKTVTELTADDRLRGSSDTSSTDKFVRSQEIDIKSTSRVEAAGKALQSALTEASEAARNFAGLMSSQADARDLNSADFTTRINSMSRASSAASDAYVERINEFIAAEREAKQSRAFYTKLYSTRVLAVDEIKNAYQSIIDYSADRIKDETGFASKRFDAIAAFSNRSAQKQ
jgi:hypothetical protein